MDAFLKDRDAMVIALKAGSECLEVTKRRGVRLSEYPETVPFLTKSALRRKFYVWIMRRIFRHDEYRKRCSAHALHDPLEIKTVYDDLLSAAHDQTLLRPAELTN